MQHNNKFPLCNPDDGDSCHSTRFVSCSKSCTPFVLSKKQKQKKNNCTCTKKLTCHVKPSKADDVTKCHQQLDKV